MDSPLMPRPDTLTKDEWEVVDSFHKLYYNRSSHWLGYPVLKNTSDLIIYQEIIVGTRPETIIECGSGGGGSALFFASILALLGDGAQVISIDTNADVQQFYRWAFPKMPEGVYPDHRPDAPGLHFLTANTVAPSTLRKVKALQHGRTMVVLDSMHSTEHVLDECEIYGPLVSPGCYLVVEDVNIAGHPVLPEWKDGGPYDAVAQFLPAHPEFRWESSLVGHYLFSYNAYLQRHRDDESVSRL
jgi:cephalosporin hydroxylase